MRCKSHPSDLSSSVGVCASCLRQLLFAYVDAQSQSLSKSQSQSQSQQQVDHQRKSDPQLHQPPPIVFPRSVSPYVSRRKLDNSDQNNRPRHQRFYSTPQVRPTYATTGDFDNTPGSFGQKPKRRFSLWSSLFRSRSDKFDTDPTRNPARAISQPASYSTPSPSPAWFSSIFSGRRKTQSRLYAVDCSVATVSERPRRGMDRGMSPVRTAESEEDQDVFEISPTVAGNSSETTEKLRRSPAVALGSAWRAKPGHSRSISGVTFCLSPLVRASPNRQWNQKSFPPEAKFPGEVTVSRKSPCPHLSKASLYCANRSRKIADFGRVNPNR